VDVTFRAKTYVNRKDEKKLQVSGDQAEFSKLLKGDAGTKEAFDKALAEALKK
jgi:hypothetical protein